MTPSPRHSIHIDGHEHTNMLRKAGIVALVEGVKAVPGVNMLLVAATAGVGAYLTEKIGDPNLPDQARTALQHLAKDYRTLLATEAKKPPDDNTLEIALVATLDIVTKHGLSAKELATAAGLDANKAAQLTLQRAQAALQALYDDRARILTRRLVGDYYRILLGHKDALSLVGLPALQTLLARQPDFEAKLLPRLATILANQETLLGRERMRAWRQARWPVRPYQSDWGLQPLMLRPEYRLVDYRGQAHEQSRDALLDWLRGLADRPPGQQVGLRFYVGPGGAGKTRLLLEVGKILQNEGWITDFLAPGGITTQNAHLFADASAPVLLILDYAGTRLNEVEALLDALTAARDRLHPYGLVLLDRSEPDWFRNALQPGSDPGYSGRAELYLIGNIETKARQIPRIRQEDLPDLYRAGVHGLAAAIGKTSQPDAPQPHLPRRPLYVLLLALLAVAGESLPADTTDEIGVLQYVWAWMLSRWQTRLKQDMEMDIEWIEDLVPNRTDKAGILEKLLVMTTLGRVFATEQGLADFLTAQNWLPRDKFGRTPDAAWLAHRLVQFFPTHQDQPGLVASIQPDPLADRVIYLFCMNHEFILDWLNNVIPPRKSTAQAALVFHRLLTSFPNLQVEEYIILRELCKWADARLTLKESQPIIEFLESRLNSPISHDEQIRVRESLKAFMQYCPKNILQEATISHDILDLIYPVGGLR